jgi:hypothetical protein
MPLERRGLSGGGFQGFVIVTLETDYLVVGAGASGMAFVDTLVAESDADVVMVDRRHRPGGHWHAAYPFVRLHQPSAFYGVNSRMLGTDSIDEVGPNAGYYECASKAEICEYYDRVLDEHLLPSGQVRFFGMSDYVGDSSGEQVFMSRLTGEKTTVRVRRKVVDATYLEASVPATHDPPYRVDATVRLVTPNELVDLSEAATGYTIIGAGKTAMDTSSWLLDNGVAPDTIRWIRPRDAWVYDRASVQPSNLLPLKLLATQVEGDALNLEAHARAKGVDDLFDRLEESGQLFRLDPEVTPTVFRGATLSKDERVGLRRIENVVRRGRVVRLTPHQIVLEQGAIPANPGEVHVDCSASGLRVAPPRPIFEAGRITLQPIRTAHIDFNAAVIAFLEASSRSDSDKNRLCPPNRYPNATVDWISMAYISMTAATRWEHEPDLAAWSEESRLNRSRGIRDHQGDASMQAALARLRENRDPALANLERLHAQAMSTSPRPT